MSSLRRGHANLLCIVPILTDDPRRESEFRSRIEFSTNIEKIERNMWVKEILYFTLSYVLKWLP